MNERAALIALAHIVEPGDPSVGRLVSRSGAQATIRHIDDGTTSLRHGAALRQRLHQLDIDRECVRAEALGISLLVRGDAHWPNGLIDLGDSEPFALWVRGELSRVASLERSISVVGARASTGYGELVCRTWIPDFIDAGLAIVSGGAFGIDAAAHRIALELEATTVSVLACGADLAYPLSHTSLLDRVAACGLVISEVPLGEQVRRQRFLTRNRLIAAMSRLTLVVEAALRSGAKSTAHAAAALNRPVMAVPGPVTSAMSAGCHVLIADAVATIARSARDVLAMIEPFGDTLPFEPPRTGRDGLTSWQARVLDAVPPSGTVGLRELTVSSGLAQHDVRAALEVLQHDGFVLMNAQGWRLAGRA